MSELSTAVPPATAQSGDVTAIAGRGTIYITLAKAWFMLTGYGIYFTLPRILSADQFGMYQVVISVVSIVNAVVVTGTYQAVSKYVSQEENKADSIKWEAIRVQAFVGGTISAGFFMLAPVVAWYLNDLRLVSYLRLAALITLFYSFYSVFTGYFNGRKKFLQQAGLDATYSTLKLGFIVLFTWLGYGVAGAVGGFALAAAGILVISFAVAGTRGRPGEVHPWELFRFQSYLLLAILVTNMLQKTDIILVKALSGVGAVQASRNAGHYGAAVNIANITFQIIVSVTFVVFPLVSESTFTEAGRTGAYVSNTLKYALMVMACVATIFSANSSTVFRLIYPPDYREGAAALGVLAYGALCYGLLYLMLTIISAGGHPIISMMIALFALTADIAFNYALIPIYLLAGAAMGTTAAMLVGTGIAGLYIKTTYGQLVPLLSVLRILGSAAVVYAVSVLLSPGPNLVGIVEFAILPLVYAGCLIASGEVGRNELRAMKRIVAG
ncbi:MAG TPA: oligosaccharide flippase family protein [Blastocatellia bacterium]|nr:oligosaccharide flippase family protein [Blastocatellia bacterium]